MTSDVREETLVQELPYVAENPRLVDPPSAKAVD